MTENVKQKFRSIVFGLFLLLVASLGLMKPTLDVGFVELTPTDIIFPITFAAWILAVITGAIRLQISRSHIVLGIYLLGLAIAWASNATSRGSVKLVGVVYLILLAVVASTIVSSIADYRRVAIAWSVGAVIPIALAIIAAVATSLLAMQAWPMSELTYHAGAVPVPNFVRISSTFVSPSMLCNYLSVTASILLVSIKLNWIGRSLATALLIATVIAAMLTLSIGLGGFFLAIALCVFVTSSSNISRIALGLGVLIAAGFLAISPFALSDHTLTQTGTVPLLGEFSASSRLLVWTEAVKSFLASPLTGIGLGMPAAEVAYQNFDGSWSMLTDAHNTFLSVAAQTGVIGLFGLLCVVVVTLRITFSGKVESEELRFIRIALGIAFLSAFVYQGMLSSFEDARHLWVLIGLIFGLENVGVKDEAASRPSP